METEAQPETSESAVGDAIVLRLSSPRNEKLNGEMVGQAKRGRECSEGKTKRLFVGEKFPRLEKTVLSLPAFFLFLLSLFTFHFSLVC